MEENNTAENIGLHKVNPSKPETIPKFADELPIPEVLTPNKQGNGYAYYEIEMKYAWHKFHRDFRETRIYGYNGMYPGPTIETMAGQTVYVRWINNLPFRHFLTVDKTVDGAAGNPGVRTVVHLHGANVAPDSDGHPKAWFTRDYEFTGSRFRRKVYQYTNDQQATTLWYHDHALGITRLNIYAGLAGFYIIHDFNELGLGLPGGKYDIPLMIQDKTFKADSSLFYPTNSDPPEPVDPSIVRRFIGNTMVVNGKVWPYLEVEPRKYRFRILNASNTNGYVFKFSNGQDFWQIGTDGGLLTNPVKLKSFTLDPAERIDVVVDFSNLQPDDKITLETGELEPPAGPGPTVMEFRVVKPKGEDKSVIPTILRPVEKLEKPIKTRRVYLSQDRDFYGRTMLTLNNSMFEDPATEKPEYDSIEIWEIANPLILPRNIAHPIHLHLVQFQILERQLFKFSTFDPEKWIKGDPQDPGIEYIGGPIRPDPSEGGAIPPDPIDKGQRAWKDTVRVEPGRQIEDPPGSGKLIETGQVTRIIVHFKNYSGEYVWHCHILEHEDHDMMRPLRIIKKYCD